MFTKLDPHIVFLQDHYINLETVDSWKEYPESLSIWIGYLSGSTRVIQFPSAEEMARGLDKLEQTMQSVMYGEY